MIGIPSVFQFLAPPVLLLCWVVGWVSWFIFLIKWERKTGESKGVVLVLAAEKSRRQGFTGATLKFAFLYIPPEDKGPSLFSLAKEDIHSIRATDVNEWWVCVALPTAIRTPTPHPWKEIQGFCRCFGLQLLFKNRKSLRNRSMFWNFRWTSDSMVNSSTKKT